MDVNTKGLVDAQFAPVFDTRNNEFNTFYCVPVRTFESGEKTSGEALLGLGIEEKKIDERLVLENMLGTVRQGCYKATELVSGGGDEKVIVPVNGLALTNKDIASAFTEYCKGVPEDVLQGLVFEVTNVSDGAAMSFLDEVAIILYLFCCTYSCRISPATTEYSYYATCNYTSVSLSLGNKSWPLDKLGPLLSRIYAKAEDSRIKVYLHGIPDTETRTAAEATGIRYLDGNGVTSN